jgi:hypothetical protein
VPQFCGPDENVTEIAARDKATFARLGITARQAYDWTMFLVDMLYVLVVKDHNRSGLGTRRNFRVEAMITQMAESSASNSSTRQESDKAEAKHETKDKTEATSRAAPTVKYGPGTAAVLATMKPPMWRGSAFMDLIPYRLNWSPWNAQEAVIAGRWRVSEIIWGGHSRCPFVCDSVHYRDRKSLPMCLPTHLATRTG